MSSPSRRTESRARRAGSATLLLLAGLAQAAAIAWPWGGQPLWWLQLLSLAVLVWQLDGLALRRAGAPDAPVAGAAASTRRLRLWRSAFWRGWLFGTVWLCASVWWLFISMHTYGGLPAVLAAAAVLGLAAAMALFYAAASSAYVVWRPTHAVPRAALFAALWTLADLSRGSWFTGFPWGAGGYAHVAGPLAGSASLVGVYGIGALAALTAAALAHCARRDPASPNAGRRKRWLAPLAVALCLGVAALQSAWVIQADDASAAPHDLHEPRDPRTAGRMQVALLQGNIPQDQKFVPGAGIPTALAWYGEQLQSATAALVVTPETALPMLPSQLPPGYLDAIAARYASGAQAAIVGLPLVDGGGYSNSVVAFRPRPGDGAANVANTATANWRYDKHHLVPFGEFVPAVFRWFTNMMQIPLGEFRRGGLAQAPFLWQGQRIAVNICYEDLFGEEIGANFADDATAPTVLLNVSNIAWFGDSTAIDQHLAISRMRALEFQRPMLRATNTGATVLIDHHGRVVQSLPRLTRGVLVADVEGRYGRTFYARWVSQMGLWPLWTLALLIVAATVLMRRRRA